jgi:hypothetical protein
LPDDPALLSRILATAPAGAAPASATPSSKRP